MPSLWDATLLRQVRFDGIDIAPPESEVQQAVEASFQHPFIGCDYYYKLFALNKNKMVSGHTKIELTNLTGNLSVEFHW